MIHRIEKDGVHRSEDQLVEESPLEIRLKYGARGQQRQQPIAVTMRTPGDDVELALGFLFTEAIIGKIQNVIETRHRPVQNLVTITLDPELRIDLSRMDRHFYTTSSCGVCGKGSLEMVESVSCYFPRPGLPQLEVETLAAMPQQLQRAQSLFAATGGIHAAALFDPMGKLLVLREDVGRHNAVDKLIGCALQKNKLPLRDQVLVLSGRIGFELVQKATMAGIPMIAAVGAPSSLAVELAEANDITLIGFLRDHRMNVYCGMERIITMME
ncbi:sulfurtransferase FdhD [Flavilitoribacter nigricans DSM 23189 = NBRC 102662]|uniref:Sulfur carrier protein FdhD n=2 Tax=Flavilitoribacter TaxID=2762562 RepID=A0A2D0N5C4_FLAN2|nr:sulfurtransferase FdhD [Flavilitoribacter nigricans DSM 23189 = NBRC 102662]